MSFTNGQVVNVRASAANKYLQGWYIQQTYDGRHEVAVQGFNNLIVTDDNIQAAGEDIHMTGLAYVFAKPDGTYTLMGMTKRNDETEAAFKQAPTLKLVGVTDLTKFNIRLTTGEGLMPKKHIMQATPSMQHS